MKHCVPYNFQLAINNNIRKKASSYVIDIKLFAYEISELTLF
jgi:hypothetical protein